MLDAVLAWIHFVAIIAFASCLFAEAFFYAGRLPAMTLARLARVDLAYGLLTIAVIASGIARVVYSPKTPAFYLHDVIFWTKMGLFVTVGLISIAPTMHFLRLRRSATDPSAIVEIEARSYRAVRWCLTAEIAVFACIPLCASLMAHGFGYV